MPSPVQVSLPAVPAEAFERFPGRWIAVRDGAIMADGETLEDLKATYDVADGDTLFRVPERNSQFL
jgi:Family of unknown function (DUF5678)